jgi:hypothetical protein
MHVRVCVELILAKIKIFPQLLVLTPPHQFHINQNPFSNILGETWVDRYNFPLCIHFMPFVQSIAQKST